MGLLKCCSQAAIAAGVGLWMCWGSRAQASSRPPSMPIAAASAPTAPITGAGPREPVALATLVEGMIRFTRWPSNNALVRLCVVGHPSLLVQFPPRGPALAGPRAVLAQAIGLKSNIRQTCDLVYFSALAPEVQRAALREIVGQPILTVGEGAEFCSDGGMFCLESLAGNGNGSAQRFSVNLDAIARSGLWINPQVLRLAQPRADNLL